MTLPLKTWSVRKTACTADLPDAKPGRAYHAAKLRRYQEMIEEHPFRMQLFGVGLRHELALHEVALVVIAPEAR